MLGLSPLQKGRWSGGGLLPVERQTRAHAHTQKEKEEEAGEEEEDRGDKKRKMCVRILDAVC